MMLDIQVQYQGMTIKKIKIKNTIKTKNKEIHNQLIEMIEMTNIEEKIIDMKIQKIEIVKKYQNKQYMRILFSIKKIFLLIRIMRNFYMETMILKHLKLKVITLFIIKIQCI
jgi:hypothetical protein